MAQPDEKSPLTGAEQEAYRLLTLMNAEWLSDPVAVQCFDDAAIIQPVRAYLAAYQRRADRQERP